MEVQTTYAEKGMVKTLGRTLQSEGFILSNWDMDRIKTVHEYTFTLGIMIEGQKRFLRQRRGIQVATVNLRNRMKWVLNIYDRRYLKQIQKIVEDVARSAGIEELNVHISDQPPRLETFGHMDGVI